MKHSIDLYQSLCMIYLFICLAWVMPVVLPAVPNLLACPHLQIGAPRVEGVDTVLHVARWRVQPVGRTARPELDPPLIEDGGACSW